MFYGFEFPLSRGYSFLFLALLQSQLGFGSLPILQVAEIQDAERNRGVEQSTIDENDSVNAEAEQIFEAGRAYYSQGSYDLALDSFNQALQLYQRSNDLTGQQYCLYNIAAVHQQQGRYREALAIYEQTLEVSRKIKDLEGEWRILTNLGTIYADQGYYAQAITSHEQALGVVRSLGDSLGEQQVLTNLGWAYTDLGQYEQGLATFQQALEAIQRFNAVTEGEIEDQRSSISVILYFVGFVQERLHQYRRAIASYEQSLQLRQEAKQLSHEAETLTSLGFAYYLIGHQRDALSTLLRALQLSKSINDQDNVVEALNYLGIVYASLGEFDKAQESHQEAFLTATDIGSLPGQISVLSNIGDLLVQQNQPELAIVFYKRSVNITEEIRRGIQGLPIEQQQSYTNTIADTYRKLAALLIQQDRILEAQQVLDLLKVQEIQDYLRRGVRSTEQTSQGVYLWEAEQRVYSSFETLLKDGQRLAELRAIPPEDLTPEQQAELLELDRQSRQIQATFNRFVDLPDVQAALQRLRLNARQAFDLDHLHQLRSNLSQLRPDAVLLYPLVLDDRLELVVLSPSLEPLHKTVDVSRVELNQTISDFLRDLQNPESDPRPNAAKLYNWLIRPIEGFLRESGAKVVLYAPDRQLRYIPLAALYDGQQWFVENYQINHITALSLTNLNTPPRSNPRILAGAYSEGRHLVARRGESPLSFGGLPFAKVEVQTIASLFPETRQLINQEFTEASTLPFLNSYNIVHFATHAMFTTGSPEDSFIVMGNGETIDLNEIRTLSLGNVDLMVLSGCQTAVSTVNLGQELGEGTEILGFGYQVQNAGARATIASLWSVDDGGTEVLMSQFYALLQQANRPKAETLQQAQIALIRGEENFRFQDALIRDRNAAGLPQLSPQDLTHPYYWAAFILIGNGL